MSDSPSNLSDSMDEDEKLSDLMDRSDSENNNEEEDINRDSEEEEEEEDEEEYDSEEDEEEDEEEDNEGKVTSGKKRLHHLGGHPKKSTSGKNLSLFEDEAKETGTDESEEETDLQEEQGYNTEVQKKYDEELNKVNRRSDYVDTTNDIIDEDALPERFKQSEESNMHFENRDLMINSRRAPTNEDPKLFIVQVKIGYEQQAVLSLMNKFRTYKRYKLTHSDEPYPFNIISCFATEARGFIYVEAFCEDFVRCTLQNMSIFQLMGKYGIRKVSLDNMINTLNLEQKNKPIHKDDWVRMKTGVYQGDLGRVYYVNEHAQKAVIQMIPRLDKYAIREMIAKATKKPVYTVSNRPKQLFFNLKDYAGAPYINEPHRDIHNSDESFIKFYNEYYKDGYLYKTFNIKTLVQGVTPEVDEMRIFKRETNTAEQFAEPTVLTMSNSVHNFQPGDRVRVIHGSLRGLEGTVKSNDTYKDIILLKVPIQGYEEVKTKSYELEKIFEKGDHVTILSGLNKGKSGFIVSIMERELDQSNIPESDRTEYHDAIILTDNDMKSVKTYMNNLAKSSEGSTFVSLTKNNYSLYDMVKLLNNRVGMIISMDQVQVVVLNPDNTESTYSYKQLRGKIQKKFLNNLVYDNQQERLHIDDQVSIDDGPFKGNSGVVRCLWKNFIYVYCSNIITHSHMVVCKSREVSIIGIHHDNSEVVIQTRQKQSNDIGRYVTILHGVNKGLRGTIRSTTNDTVTVQLMARKFFVTLKKEDILFCDDDTASMAHGTNQLFFNSENAMNSNPIGNYQHLEDHIPSTIWGSNTPSAEPDYPLHNADPSQPSALTSTQTSTPGFYPNAASEPGNTDYLNTSNTSYNENYPDPSQDRNDEENDYDNEIFPQESWLVPGCLVDVMDDNPKKECTVIEVNKEDKTATIKTKNEETLSDVPFDQIYLFKPTIVGYTVIARDDDYKDLKGQIISLENEACYIHFASSEVGIESTGIVSHYFCINEKYYKP